MFHNRTNTDFTILIADERRDCRDQLRSIIGSEGFQLQEATNSLEALELVMALPVHLFLCDLRLPDRPGLETVQQARQVRWELPCILLSDYVDAPLMRSALEMHVFSVLGKPIDRDDLLRTTRRALRRAYPDGILTSRSAHPPVTPPLGEEL